MNFLKRIWHGVTALSQGKNPRFDRVAIMLPAVHTVTASVKNEFIYALQKTTDKPLVVDCYDTSSATNINVMFAHITSNNSDLLFSVGQSCTKAAIKYANTFDRCLPIVCAGALKSTVIENKLKNVTGIVVESAGRSAAEILQLLSIKEEINHLLYIYDFLDSASSQGHETIMQVIRRRQCRYSRFNAREYSPSALKSILLESNPKVDTILLSRDNLSLRHAPQVIDICNTVGVTLACLDKNTVSLGASIGFDTPEKRYALHAASAAHAILRNKVPLQDIPVYVNPNESNLVLNTSVLRRQNINIDPSILLALKHVESCS